MNMKKAYSIAKRTVQTAVQDNYRLKKALAIDGVGASSTIGYLFGIAPGIVGDAVDIATAPAQTAYILREYKDDLTKKQKAVISTMSIVEELLPGPFDLVPSVTIAHGLAAYNKVIAEETKKI